MDDVKLEMENLNIRTETEDILKKMKTFLTVLRELENEKDENKEDALILMVKHKEVTVTEVKELKLLLDIFDPNYYSPVTKKSALS